MRLDPLYRMTFTTPEAWSVTSGGRYGVETQSFLIAEGRSTGRLSARVRAANFPRRRVDGALLPDFRGVLEVDDGAVVLFRWQGLLRDGTGARELLGSLVHEAGDGAYAWLNDEVCPVAGTVRSRAEGSGFEVVLDVARLVWEPPAPTV